MARKQSSPPPEEQPLPDGIHLRRTLRGHTGEVKRMAWSPDGCWLASPSNDSTVRIWDPRTGDCLHTLQGHEKAVYCVSWSPDSQRIVSGGQDKLIRIWSAQSGKVDQLLKGHMDAVFSVGWSPVAPIVAAGSHDNSVRLWNAEKGSQLDVFTLEEGRGTCVAWSPDGRQLARSALSEKVRLWGIEPRTPFLELTGHGTAVWFVAWAPRALGALVASTSFDRTIRIWDVETGRELKRLEEHTDQVYCASFSADGRLLATKSNDETVRLWRCDTWETVAVIPEKGKGNYLSSLAFHPHLPVLATLDNDDTAIRIWDLDIDRLLTRSTGAGRPAAVHHTTAKIVLVGDSGVGKTGLGWRLAHGDYKEHSSTHGQQFWVLKDLGALRQDGTECEAVLWDLAGQPDYRLTHALSLDDVDVALVLFTPWDPSDPLHGVDYWLKTLSHCKPRPGRSPCRIILVGARMDRGEPTLTPEELGAFCKKRGIKGGYLPTSAYRGDGLNELFARMKELVQWDEMSSTVTSVLFRQIKEYVLDLKEKRTTGEHPGGMLVAVEELQRLLAKKHGTEPTEAEVLTAVGHLASYGYVRVLQTSAGQSRVLLVPELLNNLGASLVLEARRNPRGLGALEEARLLKGQYACPELDSLSAEDRDILLDAVAGQFLEHHLCFRETSLSNEAFLIFPQLINLKKPLLDEVPSEDDISYTVNGAVENVYASLVVLLGYTNTFTRTNQWQNQAQYEIGTGSVCGFKQAADREGELEFVLYYGKDVKQTDHTLFQGLFESFLARQKVDVTSYKPLRCPKCKKLQRREAVMEMINEGSTSMCCAVCGRKLKLAGLKQPLHLSPEDRQQVAAQTHIADVRSRFEQALFRIKAFVTDQKRDIPDCFVSYAWGVPAHERWVERHLVEDLKKAGLRVIFDRRDNEPGHDLARFISQIPSCQQILVVGTPLYQQKYANKLSTTGSVVAAEVDLINQRLIHTEQMKKTVRPLLLAGEVSESFPPLLQGKIHADFRQEKAYFLTVFDLILNLYQIPKDDPAVVDLRTSLSLDE